MDVRVPFIIMVNLLSKYKSNKKRNQGELDPVVIIKMTVTLNGKGFGGF